MSSSAGYLSECGAVLTQYAAAMDEAGGDLETAMTMSIDDFVTDVNMKKLHARRLYNWLRKRQSSAESVPPPPAASPRKSPARSAAIKAKGKIASGAASPARSAPKLEATEGSSSSASTSASSAEETYKGWTVSEITLGERMSTADEQAFTGHTDARTGDTISVLWTLADSDKNKLFVAKVEQRHSDGKVNVFYMGSGEGGIEDKVSCHRIKEILKRGDLYGKAASPEKTKKKKTKGALSGGASSGVASSLKSFFKTKAVASSSSSSSSSSAAMAVDGDDSSSEEEVAAAKKRKRRAVEEKVESSSEASPGNRRVSSRSRGIFYIFYTYDLFLCFVLV